MLRKHPLIWQSDYRRTDPLIIKRQQFELKDQTLAMPALRKKPLYRYAIESDRESSFEYLVQPINLILEQEND